MQPRTRESLGDIMEATAYIARKVEASSLEEYLSNEDLRFAIERNLLIVGETVVRITDNDPATLMQITDFREAIGLRNVIIHDYKNVNDTQIWGIITGFLPGLAGVVRQLLATGDEGGFLKTYPATALISMWVRVTGVCTRSVF